MRKLATIQQIKNLEPIPEADKIEKATVLGWQLVVKKGEFKVGDYCVYCEIDSVLPERHEFEFLRPRKFRIKTAKLRGQISQGIAFPINVIKELEAVEIKEGLDVSEILGVQKYEPPPAVMMSGQVKGGFPGFIPKTDEMRIQSVPDVLTRPENVGKRCYITEKVDGTSATYFIHDGEFGVCSRNLELLETDTNIHWMVARQHDIEGKLRKLNRDIAVQGEILGQKIQSNKYKLQAHKVLIYSIFDIDRFAYLNYEEFISLAQQAGFETVPVLRDDYILGKDDVNGLVELSNEKSVLNPELPREGIVIRPVIEAQDPELGRLSFKVVNPEFLLKYEE
jgi:RNA ligase (TIGR02306 family)